MNLEALALAKGLKATPANVDRVAVKSSPTAAAWAFTQWELRNRGAQKFARADEMLFDRPALEMATNERLAVYHASCFPPDVLVVDMTVGIGADAIALAMRGSVIGYETDADRAELARWNLRVHGVDADIRVADALRSPPPDYWFADPARRSSRERFTSIEDFEPNPKEIVARFGKCHLGMLKLSPMVPDAVLMELGSRMEFISFAVECREALVMVGSDVEPGKFAFQVESSERLQFTGGVAVKSSEPQTYLYEADPAAIRAHCLPTLCSAHGLQLLADSNGYLTGDSLVSSPWLKGFRVELAGSFDLRSMKLELKKRQCGSPVLKQRGADLDLPTLAKKLKGRGSNEVRIAFYRLGKSIRYCFIEPVD
jgi:hypothetical protein